MVRHGVELHRGAVSSEAITFTLECMEMRVGELRRRTALHAVFTRYNTESTHAAAKNIQVVVPSFQNILLASLLP
jgi:hypothetical protein